MLDPPDDRAPCLDEDRAALLGVAVKQPGAAPVVQHGGELPAQVDGILEPRIQPVRAIGRMAVRRIPGDEGPAPAVGIGDVDAQIPESNVLEGTRCGGSRSPLYHGMDIEIRRCRVRGDRCVEEPGPGVDAAEKPPVSRELWMQHAVRGPRGKAFQVRVQIARLENRQHHALLEIRSTGRYACPFPDHRMGAVAADDVGALDFAARAGRLFHRRHVYAVVSQLNVGGGPAKQCGNRIQPAHPRAQHRTPSDTAAIVRAADSKNR